MKRLLNVLFALCHPHYWIQNEEYSSAWDARLTRLMDVGHRFHIENEYRAKIGAYTVWIANHPYASFRPTHPGLPSVRPSRRTIHRAYRQLLADAFPVYKHSEVDALERMMK